MKKTDNRVKFESEMQRQEDDLGAEVHLASQLTRAFSAKLHLA